MSQVTLEILIDQFEEYPLRLAEDELTIQGSMISATFDVTGFVMEQGQRLAQYLDGLEHVLAKSKFRFQYQLLVHHAAPEALAVDLSRLNFVEVNFESTDLTLSRLSGGLSLMRCLVDPSLPPLTVRPSEMFRYPPAKAARELGISDPKDLFVLRWGLTQDARHLGQSFLWLERRYPKSEAVLARLLKGLPARLPRRARWSP